MGRSTARRIGIAAMVLESAGDYRRAGVARYAFELIDAIAKEPRGHEFHLFFLPGFHVPEPWRNLSHFKIHRCWRRYNRWNLVAAGPIAQKLRLDFYFSTAHTVPIITTVPRGLMIHDLFAITHPEWFPERHSHFYRRALPDSCRRSALIFANSRATAADVEKTLGIDASKIVVTLLGPGEAMVRPGPRPSVERLRELGVPFDRYLLSLGTIEPRKNLDGLLRAFAILDKRVGLVVAGGKGWKYEQTLELIETLGLSDRVKLLGYVDDADLPDLYRGAELFVYPSFEEGFGLPILEALQAGVPVLSSNGGSLPEVGGDAARYFDPAKPEDIAASIVEALSQDRNGWIDKGTRQVSKFDWASTARQTLEAIETYLDRQGSRG